MDFENEEALQVEKILGKKVFNGKTLYLVKWKNYPLQEATWQCNKILSNVKDKIKEFKYSQRGSEPVPDIKIQDAGDQGTEGEIRDTFKRKRGRPPKLTFNSYRKAANQTTQKVNRGSRSPEENQEVFIRKRGRPRGSKNKKSIQRSNFQESQASLKSTSQISYTQLEKIMTEDQSNETIEIQQNKTKKEKKKEKIKSKMIVQYEKSSDLQFEIVDSSAENIIKRDKVDQNQEVQEKDKEKNQKPLDNKNKIVSKSSNLPMNQDKSSRGKVSQQEKQPTQSQPSQLIPHKLSNFHPPQKAQTNTGNRQQQPTAKNRENFLRGISQDKDTIEDNKWNVSSPVETFCKNKLIRVDYESSSILQFLMSQGYGSSFQNYEKGYEFYVAELQELLWQKRNLRLLNKFELKFGNFLLILQDTVSQIFSQICKIIEHPKPQLWKRQIWHPKKMDSTSSVKRLKQIRQMKQMKSNKVKRSHKTKTKEPKNKIKAEHENSSFMLVNQKEATQNQ